MWNPASAEPRPWFICPIAADGHLTSRSGRSCCRRNPHHRASVASRSHGTRNTGPSGLCRCAARKHNGASTAQRSMSSPRRSGRKVIRCQGADETNSIKLPGLKTSLRVLLNLAIISFPSLPTVSSITSSELRTSSRPFVTMYDRKP